MCCAFVLDAGIGNGARTEAQEPPAAARPRTADDAAVIVYTPAMTTPPRGVVISCANLVFEVRSLARVVDVGAGDHIHLPRILGWILSFQCSWSSVLRTAAWGVLTALAAGAYPSFRASRLCPREALAHE